MASRKSPALPAKMIYIGARVCELPGAVFLGATEKDSVTSLDREALTYASRLQEIRASYEKDDGQEMLWHDCQHMGFSSKEISRFIAHPAAITRCGYGYPIPLR
jgi:hypothetical protein